jgi:putative ABC transport system permease protein
MFFLARKNLFAERTRLILSIGGVAFAVLLILVLGGLYRGWQTKLTTYLQSLDTDLVVGQQGSADTTHSMSFLPATLADALRQVPGVSLVDDFMGRQIMVSGKEKDYRVFLVGFDPSTGRNRPLGLKSGTLDIRDGEIIIDQAFARSAGYNLGDTVPVAGQKLTVAGISTQGNSLIYQYVFVTKASARTVLQLGPQTNYFLLTADNAEAVKGELARSFPELNAMTKAEFIVNNKKLVTETFLPIVGILFLIAFAVGSAIVGLTIYTATIEKAREYGVLKAIGSSNAALYRIVLEQSLIAGTIGYAVGLLLSFVVSGLASLYVSGFISTIGWTDAVVVFLAALAMSLLASWIPTRRLAGIDPATVFKS